MFMAAHCYYNDFSAFTLKLYSVCVCAHLRLYKRFLSLCALMSSVMLAMATNIENPFSCICVCVCVSLSSVYFYSWNVIQLVGFGAFKLQFFVWSVAIESATDNNSIIIIAHGIYVYPLRTRGWKYHSIHSFNHKILKNTQSQYTQSGVARDNNA